MKNDNVGQIANNWVAFADREPLGIYSPECLALAELYSKAVDFPKTGKHQNLSHHSFISIHRFQSRNFKKMRQEYMRKFVKLSATKCWYWSTILAQAPGLNHKEHSVKPEQ